jgi:hypothetical protein
MAGDAPFDYETMAAMLGGMDDESIDQFVKLGVLGQEEAMLMKQQALARHLQGEPAPGMRDLGRIKVAANPLEHLGSLAKQGAGVYGDIATQGKLDKNLGEQKAGRASMLKGLAALSDPAAWLKRRKKNDPGFTYEDDFSSPYAGGGIDDPSEFYYRPGSWDDNPPG